MATKPSKASRKPAAVYAPAIATSWFWPVMALLLAAIISYWPALGGPFTFDDVHLPFEDRNAATAGPGFWIGGVRPVLMLTYWANYLMSGTHVVSYHLVSLLLHVITAVLVYFLLRRILDLTDITLDRRWCAFFGAGLFLLHPLQTESVAYVAGRSEVVAGLFYVAAWLVFLKHFRSQTTWWTALQILLLTGAAVLGKESAISVPAILVITDFYWNPLPVGQQVRSRLKLYLPIVTGGLLAAIWILRSLRGATSAGFGIAGLTPLTYALTQCRVIPTYIRLYLIPLGQNGDWGLRFFQSLTDGGAAFYVVLMVLLAAIIVWTYSRAKLLSFGLLIFLVALLPASSVVPVKDALAERRVYIPVIGLILASIWAFDYFRPKAQTFLVVAGCLLAASAALTYNRNFVWSSEALLWQDSVAGNPDNARAHLGLGDAYLVGRKCADAVREFQAMGRVNGMGIEVKTNLAAAYQCDHQNEQALKMLREVVVTNPTSGLYAQIGYLEAVSEHIPEAMTAMNRALELDPRNAQALAYRGVLYYTGGDHRRAYEDLHLALEIEPDNEAAQAGMAKLERRQ
jgi:hypothetical protein